MSSTDVQSIVNLFKQQRISLRYTQVDVAHQLSEMSNDKYHQSFISKLESHKLPLETVIRLVPVLQRWLAQTTEQKKTGVRLCGKRKKPTRFTEKALLLLNSIYDDNPKPSNEQITDISNSLGIDSQTI